MLCPVSLWSCSALLWSVSALWLLCSVAALFCSCSALWLLCSVAAWSVAALLCTVNLEVTLWLYLCFSVCTKTFSYMIWLQTCIAVSLCILDLCTSVLLFVPLARWFSISVLYALYSPWSSCTVNFMMLYASLKLSKLKFLSARGGLTV